ncbi:hypothetical protein FRC09_020552 [Ceratobasidium sp. 395]|nr:hypothetical protein FRC09_020552 [Ceratobasidium sp. 395]
MTEDEAASGLYSCLVTTLKDAKDNNLLDDADLINQDERWLVTCGLTLLLALAANSETTHPSIALPSAENNNRRLDTSTCPPELRPYFDRWAGLAPRIHALPRDHAHDLALLICRKSPITLPREVPDPFPLFPTPEEQAREDVRELSSKLCIISNAISVHAAFMLLWAGNLCGVMREEIQKSTVPAVITDDMTPSEIIAVLVRHSCANVTLKLDLSTCSIVPIAQDLCSFTYRCRLHDGSLVAIKTFQPDLGIVPFPLSCAARGAYAWSTCHHPNILPLIGLTEFRGQFGTVSPLADNGNVRDYVNKQPGADRLNLHVDSHIYTPSELCTLISKENVLLATVNENNILLSDSGVPMLSGFSNSILGESAIEFPRMDIDEDSPVSARWGAPELFDGYTGVSMAADVYALGMASFPG